MIAMASTVDMNAKIEEHAHCRVSSVPDSASRRIISTDRYLARYISAGEQLRRHRYTEGDS